MQIDLETIVEWMDQLDPNGTIVDPQARALLDELNASMQTFLENAGYISTSGGWVKK